MSAATKAWALTDSSGWILPWTVRDTANAARVAFEEIYGVAEFNRRGLLMVRVLVTKEGS